jgi:hypothetical protein
MSCFTIYLDHENVDVRLFFAEVVNKFKFFIKSIGPQRSKLQIINICIDFDWLNYI